MIKTCLNCNNEFEAERNRNKFCNLSCSGKFNAKKTNSPEKNKERSETMKLAWKNNTYNFSIGEKHAKAVGKYTKGRHKVNPKSIMELSLRTVQKIVKRISLCCSVCGWNEGTCDIHHINGRKIPNAHDHKNLTCVCPNHHRLIHEGKIDKSTLKTLDEILPKNWLDFYYG